MYDGKDTAFIGLIEGRANVSGCRELHPEDRESSEADLCGPVCR